MGQTVPYYVANNKFTLVATVSIHEVPESGSIPLMGVRMNDTDSTVLFGLSYTHGKKWLAIPEGAGDAEDFVEWEPNKTYQVGLRMNDSECWIAFVDRVESDCEEYNANLFDSHRISHFYIGGDGKHQSATGGHVTVTNVMLYNEKLSEAEVLYYLHASKVNIPSLGVEEQPTEQAANTGTLVASESNSKESASHEELNEDDTDEQGDNSADDLVPAAPSSTAAEGSPVPEPAAASESAGNSRPEDNTQPSEDKTSQQATMNEGNKSMQQDSDVQTQELQSAELTGVTDLERSSKSYGTQQPEGEGEASGRSSGSVSSVAASLNMDTVAAPADGEHQVQQIAELPLKTTTCGPLEPELPARRKASASRRGTEIPRVQ
ncbi:trans-sialidase [Trypanosoma cruzi]|nr:trans-sialidase [Trypanosoma cruzi]